eukprot:MONOS_15572.1-p1 / transcript=MONOS_15572.1 / gene=MONOS_15572 / organism=Monocercomonoides_exilis_PA203 / gene_product=unspecified product / transcript_product=unspecified product / location=Mono_scaffold01276:2496-7763(+) / protein_length=1698 / sequence_SO=supercontig / SO=protein_coding / is_pseudo=false
MELKVFVILLCLFVARAEKRERAVSDDGVENDAECGLESHPACKTIAYAVGVDKESTELHLRLKKNTVLETVADVRIEGKTVVIQSTTPSTQLSLDMRKGDCFMRVLSELVVNDMFISSVSSEGPRSWFAIEGKTINSMSGFVGKNLTIGSRSYEKLPNQEMNVFYVAFGKLTLVGFSNNLNGFSEHSVIAVKSVTYADINITSTTIRNLKEFNKESSVMVDVDKNTPITLRVKDSTFEKVVSEESNGGVFGTTIGGLERSSWQGGLSGQTVECKVEMENCVFTNCSGKKWTLGGGVLYMHCNDVLSVVPFLLKDVCAESCGNGVADVIYVFCEDLSFLCKNQVVFTKYPEKGPESTTSGFVCGATYDQADEWRSLVDVVGILVGEVHVQEQEKGDWHGCGRSGVECSTIDYGISHLDGSGGGDAVPTVVIHTRSKISKAVAVASIRIKGFKGTTYSQSNSGSGSESGSDSSSFPSSSSSSFPSSFSLSACSPAHPNEPAQNEDYDRFVISDSVDSGENKGVLSVTKSVYLERLLIVLPKQLVSQSKPKCVVYATPSAEHTSLKACKYSDPKSSEGMADSVNAAPFSSGSNQIVCFASICGGDLEVEDFEVDAWMDKEGGFFEISPSVCARFTRLNAHTSANASHSLIFVTGKTELSSSAEWKEGKWMGCSGSGLCTRTNHFGGLGDRFSEMKGSMSMSNCTINTVQYSRGPPCFISFEEELMQDNPGGYVTTISGCRFINSFSTYSKIGAVLSLVLGTEGLCTVSSSEFDNDYETNSIGRGIYLLCGGAPGDERDGAGRVAMKEQVQYYFSFSDLTFAKTSKPVKHVIHICCADLSTNIVPLRFRFDRETPGSMFGAYSISGSADRKAGEEDFEDLFTKYLNTTMRTTVYVGEDGADGSGCGNERSPCKTFGFGLGSLLPSERSVLYVVTKACVDRELDASGVKMSVKEEKEARVVVKEAVAGRQEGLIAADGTLGIEHIGFLVESAKTESHSALIVSRCTEVRIRSVSLEPSSNALAGQNGEGVCYGAFLVCLNGKATLEDVKITGMVFSKVESMKKPVGIVSPFTFEGCSSVEASKVVVEGCRNCEDSPLFSVGSSVRAAKLSSLMVRKIAKVEGSKPCLLQFAAPEHKEGEEYAQLEVSDSTMKDCFDDNFAGYYIQLENVNATLKNVAIRGADKEMELGKRSTEEHFASSSFQRQSSSHHIGRDSSALDEEQESGEQARSGVRDGFGEAGDSGVCRWSHSMVSLRECVAELDKVELSFSRFGGLSQCGGDVTISEGTFYENDPVAGVFGKARHNIVCGSKGRIRIESLKKGDGSSKEAPSLFLLNEGCSVEGEWGKGAKTTMFVAELAEANLSRVKGDEGRCVIVFGGANLMDCMTSFSIVRGKRGGERETVGGLHFTLHRSSEVAEALVSVGEVAKGEEDEWVGCSVQYWGVVGEVGEGDKLSTELRRFPEVPPPVPEDDPEAPKGRKKGGAGVALGIAIPLVCVGVVGVVLVVLMRQRQRKKLAGLGTEAKTEEGGVRVWGINNGSKGGGGGAEREMKTSKFVENTKDGEGEWLEQRLLGSGQKMDYHSTDNISYALESSQYQSKGSTAPDYWARSLGKSEEGHSTGQSTGQSSWLPGQHSWQSGDSSQTQKSSKFPLLPPKEIGQGRMFGGGGGARQRVFEAPDRVDVLPPFPSVPKDFVEVHDEYFSV